VPCTLCGATLQVPTPRSAQQAAADALDGNDLKTLWKEFTDARGKAAPSARARAVRSAAQAERPESPPRRRRRIRRVAIGLVTVAIFAAGGATAYRVWGTPKGWFRSRYTSAAGGFTVQLPSGLTARRFIETGGSRPAYTCEGVAFGDGTCVGVAYLDFANSGGSEELPENIMRYLERQYHGAVAVAEHSELRLGRYAGRQVTYETATIARRKSYSRWFLVGNRLYDVAWITGYRAPTTDAVDTFLNSFRLLAEPDAEVAPAEEARARTAPVPDAPPEP
jgi:hypothetical protein